MSLRRKGRGWMWGALLPVCWGGGLHAETLSDPTRPAVGAEPAPGGRGPAATAGGRVLQSVILGPGRQEAIIGGERFALGARLGDAKIVKIREGEVVLRGPGGEEVLRLFPRVEVKRPVVPPPKIGKQPKKTKKIKKIKKIGEPSR